MARRLCSVDEIGPAGHDITLPGETEPRYLMLFRRGPEVVCYDNVCPHQARGLNLAPGRFHFTREGWLMCPHHGASFDLDSGLCVEGPCTGAVLRRATLQVREGEVWLLDESD